MTFFKKSINIQGKIMSDAVIGIVVILVMIIMLVGVLSYASSLSSSADATSERAAKARAEEDARADSIKMTALRAENAAKAEDAKKAAEAKAKEQHMGRCISKKTDVHYLVSEMDQLASFEVSDRIDPFPMWTETGDKCESKCREHPECQAWSWSPGEGSTCFMSNKIIGKQVENKGSEGGRCPIEEKVI